MNRYTYDLHIHSCLSPCGDDDMTPANIAGMAALQGLQIVALTDHNSTKNCPAFFHHAHRYGLIPVAGMELTTAEDIHVICLFPTLDDAMVFGHEVGERLIQVKNKPEIFGYQYIMNEADEVAGEEEFLLINATRLDLSGAFALCEAHAGVCYPAHIDRQSNGILSTLGDFPAHPVYSTYELNRPEAGEDYRERYPILREKKCVVSSDAHSLWQIPEAAQALVLEDEPYSRALVRRRLIAYLRDWSPGAGGVVSR